jgi:predicted RNase H-like nuclease (RuvC/YqgF family)
LIEKNQTENLGVKKLARFPEPVIVGLDPGTTTAIAVLDTDGRLLSLKSKKNMTHGDVSNHISGLGRPVLVAGDRRPAPSAVERLAATFSARLIVPEDNLSRREKNRLARDFLKENFEGRMNQHERDALASAVYAYNNIRPTMTRVDQRLVTLGLSGDRELERFVRTRAIIHRDHVKRAITRFMDSR